MLEMVIYGVSFDLVGKQPIVVLRTADGNKFLPIWIGHPEAAARLMQLQDASTPRPMARNSSLPFGRGRPEPAAILMKLQNASTPRPMTHDLVPDMLEQLDAT